MKSIKFWKMQIQLLSLSERMFYKEVIDTLLAWNVLKEECLELILLKKMLESEIHVSGQTDGKEEKHQEKEGPLVHFPAEYLSNYKKNLSGCKSY